jgi:RAB protein geranylgeranyltransferase component A
VKKNFRLIGTPSLIAAASDFSASVRYQKIKQFLCFNSVQSHRNYDKEQVQFDAFFTSALDAEEWSISCPDPV